MKSITMTSDSQAVLAGSIVHEGERSDESAEITIAFYENEVPAFVSAEMERLYENVYSSLARLGIYGEDGNASTYVARKGGAAIAVFLFRRVQGEVSVLNEQIKLDEQEILRFANAVFGAYKSVNAISFHAIDASIRKFPFPFQRYYCLSDIILDLPATESDYLASLGKSTRSNIKRHMSRLRRNCPSFRFEVYAKEAASEQHIRGIIELSSARMAAKNKQTYINAEETARIIDLAKVYGVVCVGTIDGRLCAGAICYCVGTHYFMHVIAHDPAYDDYRLGMICCYLSICDAIARSGSEYRFMESTHRYKFDFLGVRMEFDNLVVYRSRAHFLLNGDRVCKTALKAYVRQARLWLLLAEHRSGFVSRVIARCMQNLRNLKRSGAVFLWGRK